jgi:hypothetical protein
MENENLILEKFKSHFVNVIIEKTKSKDKASFNKLIKELEAINKKGNDDVEELIASLKRERDLSEGKTYDEIIGMIKEDYTEISELLGIVEKESDNE